MSAIQKRVPLHKYEAAAIIHLQCLEKYGRCVIMNNEHLPFVHFCGGNFYQDRKRRTFVKNVFCTHTSLRFCSNISLLRVEI